MAWTTPNGKSRLFVMGMGHALKPRVDIVALGIVLSLLSTPACSSCTKDKDGADATEDQDVEPADVIDEDISDTPREEVLDTQTGEPEDAQDTSWEDAVVEPECGDGIVEAGEECDEGSDNSNTIPDACREDCTWHRCGDGVVDSGEHCDGSELAGETCESMGYTGGSLACTTHCRFDGASCVGSGSCGNGVVDTGEECDDANTTEWDGCNSCSISEFWINTYTIHNQTRPAVGMPRDGSITVLWDSHDQDGRDWGVYGQRYHSHGLPDGSELRLSGDPWNERSTSIAMWEDGSHVVATSVEGLDGDREGIFAYRFDASGSLLAPRFQVNTYTTNRQMAPDVAVAPDGRFVVVWTSIDQDGYEGGVFAQRYDTSGLPDGPEFQVNNSTLNDQGGPDAAMSRDGSFVLVWSSNEQDGDDWGIFAKRYDASGSPTGPEFQVNTYTAASQEGPSLATTPDGSFVVVWQSWHQDGWRIGVYGQRYDASGTPVGPEFQVNTHIDWDQRLPSVSMIPDGSFIVSWTDSMPSTPDLGIFAQWFNNAGVRLGPEFRVNTYSPCCQFSSAVVAHEDGRFVIVWTSLNQVLGSFDDVFGQRYDATGQPLGLLPW